MVDGDSATIPSIYEFKIIILSLQLNIIVIQKNLLQEKRQKQTKIMVLLKFKNSSLYYVINILKI